MAIVQVLPAAVAVVPAVVAAWRLHGTTLVAPATWAVFSLAMLVGTEVLIGARDSPDWAPAVRYAAAMTTFCPFIAVLGAKRPQHVAWQFVVLTLLVVLCQPSIEWIVLRRGTMEAIHPARLGLLVALGAMAAANYLPTRFWPSSLLLLIGQTGLVLPFLWTGSRGSWLETLRAFSPTALGLAVALAYLTALRPTKVAPSLDQGWLDFRDWYGAAWALRVAAQFNAGAALCGWGLRLEWTGFVAEPDGGVPPDEAVQTAAGSLKTILRRFVSREWLARRGLR